MSSSISKWPERLRRRSLQMANAKMTEQQLSECYQRIYRSLYPWIDEKEFDDLRAEGWSFWERRHYRKFRELGHTVAYSRGKVLELRGVYYRQLEREQAPIYA